MGYLGLAAPGTAQVPQHPLSLGLDFLRALKRNVGRKDPYRVLPERLQTSLFSVHFCVLKEIKRGLGPSLSVGSSVWLIGCLAQLEFHVSDALVQEVSSVCVTGRRCTA